MILKEEIDSEFIQLYERDSDMVLEFHGACPQVKGRHKFEILKSSQSEITPVEEVWLSDKQLKQLYFSIGRALLRDMR